MTNLGWRFYHRRLYTEARRAFERAAMLDPSNNRAVSGQAWTSLQLRQLDRALAGFNAVLARISPGDRDTWQEALRGRAWPSISPIRRTEQSKPTFCAAGVEPISCAAEPRMLWLISEPAGDGGRCSTAAWPWQ